MQVKPNHFRQFACIVVFIYLEVVAPSTKSSRTTSTSISLHLTDMTNLFFRPSGHIILHWVLIDNGKANGNYLEDYEEAIMRT